MANSDLSYQRDVTQSRTGKDMRTIITVGSQQPVHISSSTPLCSLISCSTRIIEGTFYLVKSIKSPESKINTVS